MIQKVKKGPRNYCVTVLVFLLLCGITQPIEASSYTKTTAVNESLQGQVPHSSPKTSEVPVPTVTTSSDEALIRQEEAEQEEDEAYNYGENDNDESDENDDDNNSVTEPAQQRIQRRIANIMVHGNVSTSKD